MYPKKFNLFTFFCIILYSPALISSFPGSAKSDNGQLRYNYYDVSCPTLQHIVGMGVWQAMQKEPRMAASLLRMHFHDCFVNGCDGSILLDDTDSIKGEKSAPPNANSVRGYEVIDSIKAGVEEACPKTVSCADILALAAREGAVMSGAQFWPVLLGRQDGLSASQKSATESLPTPFEPIDAIAAKFAAKGLDMKDMVTLSGAHTIGLAQCFTFKNRLFNFQGTNKPDPSISPLFLKQLQSFCANVNESNTNLVPLDTSSVLRFDNMYYKNIMSSAGLLQSDQILMSDTKTASMVKGYSLDGARFLNDFATSMMKLSTIGVIMQGGEIRNKCGSVN